MAFAENLLEGFAQAAGDAPTVNRIENEKENRRATQHEELAAQTKSILNDVAGLQQARAALDPQHPEYKSQLEANDKALHDARQTLQDLYHPERNPGALDHLGGFIREHLGGKRRAMDEKPTPGDLKEAMSSRLAKLDAAAAAPGQTPNPFEVEKRQLIAAGFSAEDADKAIRHKAGIDKTEAENWQIVDITKPDGTKRSVQHNTKSNEFADLAGNPLSKEELTGVSVAPKASAGGANRPVWKRLKNGKLVSVLLDRATNKEIPGSENPDIAPPSSQAGRMTTGFYHWVDDNNQLHSTPETRTSMPADAGIPRSAGEAKDRILGTKQNAPTSAAEKKYLDAFALASKADDVLKHPHDAVNQKRLGVALERISAGRYTQVAMDYIRKAGWGNTIEEWANRPGTGELPADIVRQFVQGAHQERDSAKAAWDEARSGGGVTAPAGPKVLKFNPASGKLE